MRATAPNAETWLEVGVAAFSVALVAAIAVLVLGRWQGAASRRRRYDEAPPRSGAVAAERHRNVGAAAAR